MARYCFPGFLCRYSHLTIGVGVGWGGGWGVGKRICVSKLTIICSDNGLAPGCCQAIVWTDARISLIETIGTNFSKIQSKFIYLHSRKCLWKCPLENGVYFVSASIYFTQMYQINIDESCWRSICVILYDNNTNMLIYINILIYNNTMKLAI